MASPSERDFDRLAAALAALLASAWRQHQLEEDVAVDETAAAGEEVRDDAGVTRSSR